MKSKTYRRSKKKFKTARAAWADIKRKTSADYRGLKARHTRTHWVWVST